MLTDDAWLSMPPAPHQYHGTGAIAAFLQASFGYRGERRVYLVPTRANTQPALASYLSGTDRASAAPAGLFVLTMAGPRIRALTRFHRDELYPRFGLPASVPGRPRTPQADHTPRADRPSGAEAAVQLVDLLIQAGHRALDDQPGRDLVDGQRDHRG